MTDTDLTREALYAYAEMLERKARHWRKERGEDNRELWRQTARRLREIALTTGTA